RPNLAFQAPEPAKRNGENFRDCPECPWVVAIPKGKFLMGSPTTEAGSLDDERPQHDVSISYDLAIGKFEVTFAEWDACVAARGCTRTPRDFGRVRGQFPVVDVNWFDTQEYVKWLSKRTHKKYRLLSEAEWEYAARAGMQSLYPWGNKAV